MLGQSISRNSLLLALFAVCTTALIAGTFLFTKDKITLQKRMAEERALLEIVPRSRHDNSMLDDTLDAGPDAEGLGLAEDRKIYLARAEGQVVAAIIPAVTPDGYRGDIAMIVGINFDGTIAGVRVVEHRETPGLGDKVDLKKSDWILDFNGKSLVNPSSAGWKVKKEGGEFDQFTGATITPRAVVYQILKTLQYFNDDQQRLLEQSALNTEQAAQ